MIRKTIVSTLLIASLAACSKTPSCESPEAATWFKDTLSAPVNAYIAKFVKFVPVNYMLDDIVTVAHDKDGDKYTCKANLRLDISKEIVSTMTTFQTAAEKDPGLNQIVYKEMHDKLATNSKDMPEWETQFKNEALASATFIQGGLAVKNENTKDEKYYFAVPVNYEIHSIKSSDGSFEIQTNFNEKDSSILSSSFGIFFTEYVLEKELLAHPELVAKYKVDAAASVAKAAQDKQDAIDKKNADAEAAQAALDKEAANQIAAAEAKKQADEAERQAGIAERQAAMSAIDWTACTEPGYPRNSLRNEEEGNTRIQFLVNVDGSVADSKIEKSSGFRALDAAAKNALSLCKFKPIIVSGKPQKGWAPVDYVWQLPNSIQ